MGPRNEKTRVSGVKSHKEAGGRKARELMTGETRRGAKRLAATRARLHAWRVHLSPTGGAAFIPIAPAQIVFLAKYGRGQGKGRRFVDFVGQQEAGSSKSCWVTFPIRAAAE